jgi:DNA topoisomerase-3
LAEYDNLAASAYLRAKVDYLMGINFSRALSLRYGNQLASGLKMRFASVSVGRVMTCVLGMVVRREREIRDFVKTPFYRVISLLDISGRETPAEWKVTEGSVAWGKPILYKDNGFKKKEDAQKLIDYLEAEKPVEAVIDSITRKTEKKNPPLLYNLAELQNDCSKIFKISPDETLKVVQELYEKRMVTYPRTDARVLSSAVAKEIGKNISGLQEIAVFGDFAKEVLSQDAYKKIGSTRYTNDKMITDHYAIIPTGQGAGGLDRLPPVQAGVYRLIVRRFLSIFYPPAQYQKVSLTVKIRTESFTANFKALKEAGYLKVAQADIFGKDGARQEEAAEKQEDPEKAGEAEVGADDPFMEVLKKLKKGMKLSVNGFQIKEGETSPPKRYNSGSIILAMENAGQLIEDEELRAQIKNSGIGTSATRAEILKKLFTIRYLALNKKTQIITPTLMGEMVYDIVDQSIRSLLNPELTASWEKGLNYVSEGSITSDVYMEKLDKFISDRVYFVRRLNNQSELRAKFEAAAKYYPTSSGRTGGGPKKRKNNENKQQPV